MLIQSHGQSLDNMLNTDSREIQKSMLRKQLHYIW
jgi:hypothetical protein